MKYKLNTLIALGLLSTLSVEGAIVSKKLINNSFNETSMTKYSDNKILENESILISQSYRLGDSILLK